MGDNPGKTFMDYLGLAQQQNAPFAVQTPTAKELIFRTVANSLPPPGQMRVGNSIGSRILGGVARVGGSFADVTADELARQRLDPMQRQLAIAKAILSSANKPPDMEPAPGATQPVSQFPGSSAPIREQNITGAPQMAPPPPPPFANVSPEMLVASGLFPAIAEQISPAKQAELRSKEAEIAFKQGPQTRYYESQTAENEDQRRRARDKETRDADFTRQYREAREKNPSATVDMLAGLVGEIAARTGASNDVIKPILDGFGTAGQLSYHQESLKVQRERIAQDQAQFRQSLDRGDTNAARQIVANELSDINNLAKQEQNAIKTSERVLQEGQKALSDVMTKTNPQAVLQVEGEMVRARGQIEASKKSLEELGRQRADARRRLDGLFAGTRAGKDVLSREPSQPPKPPPGAETGARGGGSRQERKDRVFKEFDIY